MGQHGAIVVVVVTVGAGAGVVGIDGLHRHLWGAGHRWPTARSRKLPIDTWFRAHPDLVVPPEEAGSPFRFYEAFAEPLNQSLANVNNVPD